MHSKNRYKGSLSSETVRSDSPSSFEDAAGCTALFGTQFVRSEYVFFANKISAKIRNHCPSTPISLTKLCVWRIQIIKFTCGKAASACLCCLSAAEEDCSP